MRPRLGGISSFLDVQSVRALPSFRDTRPLLQRSHYLRRSGTAIQEDKYEDRVNPRRNASRNWVRSRAVILALATLSR